MINFKYASRFCKEDMSLIENYEQAANDKTQTWDCHHRLEIELNLSRQELKDRNLYYDRPASELIFLTHSDHMKLHKSRRTVTEETKKKQGDARKKYRGEKHPLFGTHPTWMNNGIIRVFPRTQEEIEYYRERGYQFGKKLSTILH